MEISRSEYLALTRRIEELEKRQRSIGLPHDRGWAYAVDELPIETVRMHGCRPAELRLYYAKEARDAWAAFTKLAKCIHHRDPVITKTRDCFGEAVYRDIWVGTTNPKKYADLTDEQKELSLAMLNELIPIYNKYFKAAHPHVAVNRHSEEMFFAPIEYEE